MYRSIIFTAEIFSRFLWFIYWLPSEDSENDDSQYNQWSGWEQIKKGKNEGNSTFYIFSEVL